MDLACLVWLSIFFLHFTVQFIRGCLMALTEPLMRRAIVHSTCTFTFPHHKPECYIFPIFVPKIEKSIFNLVFQKIYIHGYYDIILDNLISQRAKNDFSFKNIYLNMIGQRVCILFIQLLSWRSSSSCKMCNRDILLYITVLGLAHYFIYINSS